MKCDTCKQDNVISTNAPFSNPENPGDNFNGATIIPTTDEYENPWMIACIWIIIVLLSLSFCLFLSYNHKKMKKIQNSEYLI